MSTVEMYGQSIWFDASSSSSALQGKFVITTSRTFSIAAYVDYASRAGQAHNIAGVPEIYTQIELRKVL